MTSLLWLLLASAHALPSYAAPAAVQAPSQDPFSWHASHDVSGERLVLTLRIPEGHTVYRDQVEVTVVADGGVQVGKPDLPPGEQRVDPAGKDARELYATDMVVYVPVSATDGMVELELRHQGCKGGLCFSPVTQRLWVQVRAPEPASR